MEKPLEGIRVLDLGRFVSAPFCGMMLGDMGAEVIKIEKPEKGEDCRSLGPFMNGESLYIPTFNRNKKGITIQTRSPEGMKLLKDLIKKSDVIIENFRPGTVKKMGIDYDELVKINPRIIMASISGYGQTGPDAFKPAFDPVAQAVGGLYAVTGTEESGPIATGTIMADFTTGLYTAYAISLAIIQREKTGRGQYIDMSMVDCVVSMLHTYVANYSANGIVPERHGNRDPISAPADCYRARDGYVVMHAGEDKAYDLLKKVIGDKRLDDPKFDDHHDRVKYQDELEGYIQEWFSKLSAEEAEKRLSEGGVITAPVNDMPRLFKSEQIRSRGMLVDIEVPGAGKCAFQGNPIKMSDAPVSYTRAPKIGEHNAEVLKGVLGLDDTAVKSLQKNGVI